MLKRWIEVITHKNSWLLDMEFLLSNYECRWGTDCRGINPQRPDLGCCANGAYLDDDDVELLKHVVPELTPDVWQRHGTEWLEEVKEPNRFGIPTKTGDVKTALQNPEDIVSGCVFANDPDFAGGAGCALHIHSMNKGENPLHGKPSICWQMPLVAEEVEEIGSIIVHMFSWTKDDYPWFCGQDDVTWVGDKPVYQTMKEELKAMVEGFGDEEAFPAIWSVCEQAFRQSAQWKGEKPLVKPVPVTLMLRD